MFVALIIQHAKEMLRIVVCGLSDSTIFFHISYKRHDFRKEVIGYKMCFDFLYNFCLKHFPFREEFSEILS